MSLPTIFDACRPRTDVFAGAIRDDEFMADLSRLVNRTASADYLDPVAFFAKSYPTRGIKELMKAVCLRIFGKGVEAASDLEALERLRRLTFAETVPAPKIAEQIPLPLAEAEPSLNVDK